MARAYLMDRNIEGAYAEIETARQLLVNSDKDYILNKELEEVAEGLL
jgi:hypothetical protein